MRGVYLSYTAVTNGERKMVARLEDHVSDVVQFLTFCAHVFRIQKRSSVGI